MITQVRATGRRSLNYFELLFSGTGIISDVFHIFGTTQWSNEVWKKIRSGSASCSAHVLNNLQEMLSGPLAFPL